MVPEIYDVMDKVAEIMVTNQSTQVQELSRSVLLQFLLDYPQGQGRLRTQMAFLAKNLSYVFESGRLSVMEIVSAIVSKFDEGLIREYTELLFVSLFMVLANDESNFGYVVGARPRNSTCRSGLIFLDLSDPSKPSSPGCASADGYVHDAQCLIYRGPDKRYEGREICYGYNEDSLTICMFHFPENVFS